MLIGVKVTRKEVPQRESASLDRSRDPRSGEEPRLKRRNAGDRGRAKETTGIIAVDIARMTLKTLDEKDARG